jgi:hypothetical protein
LDQNLPKFSRREKEKEKEKKKKKSKKIRGECRRQLFDANQVNVSLKCGLAREYLTRR